MPRSDAPRSGRTLFRRLRVALGAAISWSTLLALLLLALGKILTDRFHWSQYLGWVPTIPALIAATIATLLAWPLAPRPARWTRRASWTLIAMGVAYATLLEWPAVDVASPPPREERLRVAFWNFSESGEPGWEDPVIALDPDVAIVRGGSCTSPEGVRRRMGENASFCWDEGFMVTSRLPIKAWGVGKLNVRQGMGLDPRSADYIRKGRDPGRAMWLILDASKSLGRDVTLWLVDMPSDLSLWRDPAMRDARAALEKGPATHYVLDSMDRWVEAPILSGSIVSQPFASPDLILGDFNTPHLSHSLDLIRNGFQRVSSQAGQGYAATFPRHFPLWQLDQAFAAPSLRAVTHRVLNTGRGTHCLLTFDVATR